MKINIYETVEVTDEQRVRLGAVLAGSLKPKRQATRDEIKEFVWGHGRGWAVDLDDVYNQVAESAEDAPSEDADSEDPSDEDLI